MGFRSVPKSLTLSDLKRPNGRHYAFFHTIRQLSKPTALLHQLNLARPIVYGARHAPYLW